ncbi:hypothetical protein DL95DRAFT_454085 [Leptodontidium sp. 2 PMI_412]|nr:hypothetical protein DL95DRAFT_454085 [Leptodontidium sp. 2 PMI_412]
MDRFDSNSLTPSHRQHSKNAEKQTARQIREAQQQYLTFHSKRLCHHSDWDYIRSHAEDFPFQREAEPAKESILALKNNQTYSQSGIIQSAGSALFELAESKFLLVVNSQNKRLLEPVEDENARHNEDDDDDIYVGPDDRKSIPQTTSPRRTRQNGKAIAPTSSRAAVVALDDDGDDDGDYVASSNLPPISQARRTRRSSTSPARHSRSGIGIAVVIPSFQPPHKRFRRKTSSFNF